VAGVGGGALYAPLQGVYADAKNVQLSYWVSWVGFMMTLFYGVGMVVWKHKQSMVDGKRKRSEVEGRSSKEVDQIGEKRLDDVASMGAD
jgi:FHS family L-fucose permease-like MFS transporter